MASAKSLSIKVGVVRRTIRELEGYRSELAMNQAKVAELREETSEEGLAKRRQWESVAAETEAMLPDTVNRLADAVDELRQLLIRAKEDEIVDDPEVVAEAERVLASADGIRAVE